MRAEIGLPVFFIVVASAVPLNAHFCQCLPISPECWRNATKLRTIKLPHIPKKLRDMKREEICRLLADKLIN